jgi:hypothetical protein
MEKASQNPDSAWKTLDYIAVVCPFFLAFYFFAIVVSNYSPVWYKYFYWPAMHGSIVIFATMTFASARARGVLWHPGRAWFFLKALQKQISFLDYAKAVILVASLGYAFSRAVEVMDMTILVYGLVSIFWFRKNGTARTIMLIFLALTLAALLGQKERLAEDVASYTFDFMIIAVILEALNYNET